MSEPEIGTEHADAHNATALEPHDHLHGHGEGQHSHAGWTPDRVQARMRRDGWCAFLVKGAPRVVTGEKTTPGIDSYCMKRTPCPEHPDVSEKESIT